MNANNLAGYLFIALALYSAYHNLDPSAVFGSLIMAKLCWMHATMLLSKKEVTDAAFIMVEGALATEYEKKFKET